MANRKILFALLVLCLSNLSVCGRFGGRSSGRSSSGGGSWGKSWGGSSSSGHSSGGSSYKPSSSWSTGSSSSSWSKPSYPSSSGLSGYSWSKPSYPSSSSGLSGSSWSKPSYPSSSSGLSGFSWGKPSYPSSSSGLSGSSWSKPSYPSSSSGLSGSGSSSHSYPSSSSGLSGSGSNSYNKPSTSWWSGSGSGSHSYPSSSSGLSGSGSGSKYPSGSGSHSYPTNTGLSGGSRSSGSGYKPYYNINSGRYDTHSYHYIPHTYYTAPQHVYVTQYRNSDSRYGDLLTGLTLYNMGRSHSHYHDHYYYDDYYRHRYNDNNYNTGSYNNYNHQNNNYQSQSSYSKPQDEATCSLRINNDGKLDVLKIPCEIVSTFTEGGKKVQSETHHANTTCTTNITVTPNPVPVGASNVTAINGTKDTQLVGRNLTTDDGFRPLADVLRFLDQYDLSTTTNSPFATFTSIPIKIDKPISTKNTTSVTFTNKTDGTYIQTTTTVTDNQTVVNVTTCSNQTYTDPFSVKGGALTAFDKMECLVDIRTKDAHFQNPVECKTLMEYAKMPEPKKDNKPLLPPREKLKSWMEKPPWWLAMFIAV